MKSVLMMLMTAAVLAFAAAPAVEAAQTPKKYKSLRGTSYLPYKSKRPGYSYTYVDAINTKKFNDPALGPNSQGQPFDNGFFFEQPTGIYGGTTPYMH